MLCLLDVDDIAFDSDHSEDIHVENISRSTEPGELGQVHGRFACRMYVEMTRVSDVGKEKVVLALGGDPGDNYYPIVISTRWQSPFRPIFSDLCMVFTLSSEHGKPFSRVCCSEKRTEVFCT